MSFDDIYVKDISCVVKYVPDIKTWKSANTTHIMGVHLKGAVAHTFSNKQFTIQEGCVFFFNQNEEYQADMLSPSEAYSVHFTTYEPISSESFCIKTNNISSITALLEKIERHLLITSGNKNTIHRCFYELCEKIDLLAKKEYRPGNAQIMYAKEYMNLHFKEKNCIDKAADLYGVSRRRFNDIFKQNVHYTPNEYITERKCALAKTLLGMKMLSITQISEMCGFDNVYYFSKVFKKTTGISPSKYKKEMPDSSI